MDLGSGSQKNEAVFFVAYRPGPSPEDNTGLQICNRRSMTLMERSRSTHLLPQTQRESRKLPATANATKDRRREQLLYSLTNSTIAPEHTPSRRWSRRTKIRCEANATAAPALLGKAIAHIQPRRGKI
jgi:hypothetical protein